MLKCISDFDSFIYVHNFNNISAVTTDEGEGTLRPKSLVILNITLILSSSVNK